MSGRPVVHIEIPAANRDSVAQFYKDMFGWEYHHMDMYTTFRAENTAGGFPDVSELSPAGKVMVYVGSEDIEMDLKQIESKGGKQVMPKTEVPGFGWFAVFADPTGNHLALWTPKQP